MLHSIDLNPSSLLRVLDWAALRLKLSWKIRSKVSKRLRIVKQIWDINLQWQSWKLITLVLWFCQEMCKVVYMSSKILQLTVGSCDLSQAEKNTVVARSAKFTQNGPGWKKSSFWAKIVVILRVAQLVRTVFFYQLEINHEIQQSIE